MDNLIPYLESQRVYTWNQVTSSVLRSYAAYLKGGGPTRANLKSYSDKSVVNELTFAKQVIKWLIEEGHLHGGQPVRLKVSKAESERPYCWRPEEVKAMVDFCRSRGRLAWLGDIVTALACTGLRISELSGLRWADVDLENGMLTLTDETNFAGAGVERRRLKNGRSRSLPIHESFRNVLQQRPQNGALVFRGPRGAKLDPDTVRRILIRDVLTPLAGQFPTPEGQRGFSKGRLHSFRHFFCSTCANDGVPVQMLMEWLGHRNSDMVRHYYHVHNTQAKRKIDQINFLGCGADGPLGT
jgi:integrase